MTTDRQTLLRIAREEKDHIKVVKGERTAYACRVREAHAAGENILSIAMDGADQGAYGLPYFCQVRRSPLWFLACKFSHLLSRQNNQAPFLRSGSTLLVFVFIQSEYICFVTWRDSHGMFWVIGSQLYDTLFVSGGPM